MTRAEQVHRELRAALLRGEFTYGRRLVEEQLADRYATSRTPVREALRRLAAEGLVRHEPNRGVQVADWGVADLDEIFLAYYGAPGLAPPTRRDPDADAEVETETEVQA